jgi:two-component system OmpR family sensor kinase
MLWHIHDLEPVLRAERAEEEAAALRAANETKGELLALISHELRTPLTVIVGHAAGMRRAQSANEDVAVRASEIQEQATRLQGMIENMLSLLLIEQEERKELEPVLLQPEIERAIQHHRLRYPDREIIVHALPESSTVMADELAIGHVLENLIENAEKYSDEATAIEIEVEDDGEMARVRVCDRGIGLTAQEAETVFRPFYRARMARQRTPGMGLGLVVVRRLLDAMGGTISAAPREGGGSTFSFALPLALRADEAELQPGNVP